MELCQFEQSELLTLTKKDYETILQIPKTPELNARVEFLQVCPSKY